MVQKVNGTVVLKTGNLPIPLRHINLALFKKDTKVQETRTDSSGKFAFAANLTNGSYQLKIKSKKYSGKITFEINNLILIAKKIP